MPNPYQLLLNSQNLSDTHHDTRFQYTTKQDAVIMY